MSDILKVTTPLINKSQIAPSRPSTDPTVPFNMIDTNKISKLMDQKHTAGQNNTLLLNTDSSSILTSMLNDPQGSVQFLRIIYLLQEVISMLPMTNDVISKEIVDLFHSLLIQPENIVEELLNQASMSSNFQGALFDTLRELLNNAKQGSSPNEMSTFHAPHVPNQMVEELKADIANLMRAMNQTLVRGDILSSLASNLKYLSDEFGVVGSLSSRLETLSQSFEELSQMAGMDDNKNVVIQQNFNELKDRMLALIKEMESSLLFNQKISKNVSIMHYNLSRFQMDDIFLSETLKQIIKHLPEAQQQQFEEMMNSYLASAKTQMQEDVSSSKVMNALTELIKMETSKTHFLSQESIEKIVQSLLTSPSNFTPLLHFVIPMDYHGLRAFAELWIDSKASKKDKDNTREDSSDVHLLMSMDVDYFGRFEVEAKIRDNRLSLAIYCPIEVVKQFQGLKSDLQIMIHQSSFALENVSISSLAHPRTLMEVFENLSSKRSGINVLV